MTMHTAFGKASAIGQTPDALLAILTNRVENDNALGPQSHGVGPYSEGWLTSRKSALQSTRSTATCPALRGCPLVAMSHNTTSWKSHTSTWRWTAGNDGRSPEGGKAHRVGRHPALARQKTIGQHDQREMSMQPIPAPALVVVQATLAFGVLIKLFDRPATVG